MDSLAVLGLLFRWLHILAAMTAVGGTIFVRFVLLPSQGVLSAEQRAELHAQMRARWSKIVAAAIGILLLSGLYNFFTINQQLASPRLYHPLFGVKFLLALTIFTIASLLTGATAAAEKTRANARVWMNVNIVLAVIVVCISGYLRTIPRKPISAEVPASATKPADAEK